jgi:predicted dehydrogenase
MPNVAVFSGCSEVTRIFVNILREKEFNVIALWAKTIQESQELANELKIYFHTNKIDEVLLRKDVDMVFVFCQPNLHQCIVVKSLSIGKHVFCETPLGLNLMEAQKMVHSAEYYPLLALVNHTLRFLPAIVNLKKAINDNCIGQLSLIDVSVKISSLINNNYDWLADGNQGGGILNLFGSHIIDLIYFLTGKKATRVHGIVRTFIKQTDSIYGIRQITAPDFCNFQMELQGGLLVIVNLQSNKSGRNGFDQDVTVIGQNGNLVVVGGDLICYKRKGSDSNVEYKEEKLYVEIQDMRISESSTLPKVYIKGMSKMISALKESFTTSSNTTVWNKEPVASAANFNDGLYVQTVLEAIKKSSDNRMWVKIESPDLKN